jgi:hypothetical protein
MNVQRGVNRQSRGMPASTSLGSCGDDDATGNFWCYVRMAETAVANSLAKTCLGNRSFAS